MRLLITVILFSVLACAQMPGGTDPQGSAPAAAPKTSPSGAPASPAPRPPNDGGSAPLGIDFSHAPAIVAFSCCADQTLAQPIWEKIGKDMPDLFVFMGDTVDDTRADQGTLTDQFKKLDKVPEYKAFRAQVPILAIWDDLDLGTKNGGGDAPTRHQTRKEFLNYWSYVRTSIPFNQDALYHAKTLGGQVTGKRRKKVNGPSLQVIILDTRTDRRDGRMLGPEQWDWLEEQLKKPAEFRLLVSSTPITAKDPTLEKWDDVPGEREKLMALFKRVSIKNLVVLSGAPRAPGISKTEIKGAGTLVEVTAGPLTPVPAAQGTTDESYGLARFDWKKKSVKFEIKDAKGAVVDSTEVKMH